MSAMIEVLSLAGQEYLGVVVVVDGERNAMDLAEVKKFDGGETADSAGSWHLTILILQRVGRRRGRHIARVSLLSVEL